MVLNPMSAGTESPLELRNAPVQDRSRQRLQRILDVAEALIGARGVDALKMSDVAGEAGVPIGAVYNFFPNKTALIAHLLSRHLTQMSERAPVQVFLKSRTTDPVAYGQVAADAFIDMYDYILQRTAFREIWLGGQAIQEIQKVDLDDSRRFANAIAPGLKALTPGQSAQEVGAKALAICHLTGSAMRLALAGTRVEGDRIIKSYIEMVLAHIGLGGEEIAQVSIRPKYAGRGSSSKATKGRAP